MGVMPRSRRIEQVTARFDRVERALSQPYPPARPQLEEIESAFGDPVSFLRYPLLNLAAAS